MACLTTYTWIRWGTRGSLARAVVISRMIVNPSVGMSLIHTNFLCESVSNLDHLIFFYPAVKVDHSGLSVYTASLPHNT